ncbi:hypothetical protein A3Q56_04585 [Intoshia linei]|uniref:DNA-directed RNA polymerase subunit beta n=1 Tax=Intoshia linei TaxID=1819745 RepID=A0A177B1S7_9BILA|nr:hypothetical protein A3Q56_04585 [Intoshia linei]
MQELVEANSLITSNLNDSFYLKFKNIKVGTPISNDSMDMKNTLTPHQCRLRDMTYNAPITVDIEYLRSNQRIYRKDVNIGKLPIMLGSNRCILRNKSEAQLAILQECPHDHGGYFIVKGVEKVICMQEQLSKNRMISSKDSQGNTVVGVISSTTAKKSKSDLIWKKNQVYLKAGFFSENIPIVILLKALCLECDLEIAEIMGSEDCVLKNVLFSIEESYKHGVNDKNTAISFLYDRIRLLKNKTNEKVSAKNQEALFLINDNILPHVPRENNNFKRKCIFLCLMWKKTILVQHGIVLVDDRDHYGNKRLEMAGNMISYLFEDAFKRLIFEIQKTIDRSFQKSSIMQFDIIKHIRQDTLTQSIQNALGTGRWCIKRFRMDRAGVSQLVSRLSYISSLGHMTRISSQFEKSRKVSGPRALQPSQWGMLCPSDTPEGESCGLVKNLALIANVTTDQDECNVKNILLLFGVEDVNLLNGHQLNCKQFSKVFLNGNLLGIVKDGIKLIQIVKKLRRKARIHYFVSIFQDNNRCIYVSTDGGRLTRPYILCENGIALVSQRHLDQLESKMINFDDLVFDGLIEYLDVNEQNDAFIAMRPHDVTEEITHLEFEPFTLLGVCAGLIPYPHHNQSPRNTYQCAMGKQAIGTIGYNQYNRFDTLLYSLVYPQRPLVKTKTIDLIGFNKIPAGQNGIVAVMSYSGYDIEDAIVINKSSLDRGFGRCMVHRKHKAVCRRVTACDFEKISGATINTDTNTPIWSHTCLDVDGIVNPGEAVHDNMVLVNKKIPEVENVAKTSAIPAVSYKSAPLKYKGIEKSYVDKVLVTANTEESLIVKVLLRQTRRPEIGDKFSSRHGQKGVVGLVVPQEDMPFTESGICPDIIMNPHGYPSRMTVGKLLELMGSKAAALDGTFHDGTAFGGDKIEDLSSIMKDHGYNYLGKDLVTSGITGEIMEAYIYFGPIYYQKLKHMVMDKIHARARGPYAALTRQPTEGRSKDGGLRLGEMERDCLIAHGTRSIHLKSCTIQYPMNSPTEYDVWNQLCNIIEL